MKVTLNGYQQVARETAIYPEKVGLVYCALKLAGEAGEVSDKIGKILRGDRKRGEATHDLALELGDVLWYVAMLAHELGYTLEEIAEMNTRKLLSRKERGVLKGTGDNR